MQLCYLVLLCMLVSSSCVGQNLIANGDFEQHACPQYVGDIEFARGWHNGNHNTPDLFSRCVKDRETGLHVPDNYVGTRQPASGDAYAGLFLFGNRDRDASRKSLYEHDESIWSSLITPLQPGQTYQLRMWVGLADSAQYYSAYMTAVFGPTAFDALGRNEQGQAVLLPIAPLAKGRAWQEVVITFQPLKPWRCISLGLARSVFTRKQYQQALLQQNMGPLIRNDRMCYYYIDNITLVRVK